MNNIPEEEELKRKLREYDRRYPAILDDAKPHLVEGRAVDLGHTLDALEVLLDLFKLDPQLKASHRILIPSVIFHDCGWSKVPKNMLPGSYGDVKEDNPGKIIHQEQGAGIARRILKKHSYPEDCIEEVSFIVSVHDKPEEYKKHALAGIVAEIDKLVRYKPTLFWGLINDGTFKNREERVAFLEKGLGKWFTKPEFRQKAASLLEERKREQGKP